MNSKTIASHHFQSGVLFFQRQNYEQAIYHFRKALEIDPTLVNAYNYIGNSLQARKKYDEAISCYEKAININPDDPTAYINSGIALQNINQPERALEYFRAALKINPNLHQAYDYMGLAFAIQGKIEESIYCYLRSLQINPSSVMSLVNMGNLLSKTGRLKEAESFYRQAIQISPDNPKPFQALLMNMIYNPDNSAFSIFSEHMRFANKHEEPLGSHISNHANDRTPDRRLRIGYVSPDFRRHSVGYFIEPVLAAHRRNQFEVFCYSAVETTDEMTARIRHYADRWKDIVAMSDEAAAASVRKDKIDIMIDLAGHTCDNRLLLFARKPAPVQVTWIGYPATTGLRSVDYKIADNYTDPPGLTEKYYTEKLMRMPDSFICYLPDRESPRVSALPALTANHITFASFNNFAKVSAEIIGLWIKILLRLPGSRLIIKAESLADRIIRKNTVDFFTCRGIDASRVELLSWKSSTKDHLETYNRVDIGLDTFPYNGTTTTCEAFWMGVPVITLSGETHASRVGLSLLNNIGLPELAAKTGDEYIDISLKLATDMKRLKFLRENLRQIMDHSPLTNASQFTINLENLYRAAWQAYCNSF